MGIRATLCGRVGSCRSGVEGGVSRQAAIGQKQTFKPLAKYNVEKIAFKNFGASVQPRKREDS